MCYSVCSFVCVCCNIKKDNRIKHTLEYCIQIKSCTALLFKSFINKQACVLEYLCKCHVFVVFRPSIASQARTRFLLSHDLTTNPSSKSILKRLYLWFPILNAWNVSSKLSCQNAILFTLAVEYHYDNHSCLCLEYIHIPTTMANLEAQHKSQ